MRRSRRFRSRQTTAKVWRSRIAEVKGQIGQDRSKTTFPPRIFCNPTGHFKLSTYTAILVVRVSGEHNDVGRELGCERCFAEERIFPRKSCQFPPPQSGILANFCYII